MTPIWHMPLLYELQQTHALICMLQGNLRAMWDICHQGPYALQCKQACRSITRLHAIITQLPDVNATGAMNMGPSALSQGTLYVGLHVQVCLHTYILNKHCW